MSRDTIDVDHFRARVAQDALNEATSGYWLDRAVTFAAVGTPACDEIAQACRNRAVVELLPDVDPIDEAIAWHWAAVAGATEAPPLEQAEAQLRAAIDAGALPDEIARLTRTVDALDPALRRMGAAA
jgi:hypothetical protein